MTVTLWFKYTGSDNEFEGLFSNGDCEDDASLLLTIGGGVAQGQFIANKKVRFGADKPARVSFKSKCQKGQIDEEAKIVRVSPKLKSQKAQFGGGLQSDQGQGRRMQELV